MKKLHIIEIPLEERDWRVELALSNLIFNFLNARCYTNYFTFKDFETLPERTLRKRFNKAVKKFFDRENKTHSPWGPVENCVICCYMQHIDTVKRILSLHQERGWVKEGELEFYLFDSNNQTIKKNE